jgi:hypothetical protein
MNDTLIAGGHTAPATETWSGDLTGLESRADLDSLEDLHAQRRQLLPEYAALRALHGTFGKWDARRKQMLAAIYVSVRMDAQAKGEKTTEAYLDALARADERYARLIDEGIDGATRFVELDTQMSEVMEKIRNRELAMSTYTAEVRLGR